MMLAIVFLLIPAVLIILSQRITVFDKIGVVILAFLSGFVLAFAVDFKALFGEASANSVMQNLSEISVALALPLILFSMNVKKAFVTAGLAMKAMLLSLLSVVVASFAGMLVFADKIDNMWQVAGMAVGAYTGSGVNMGSIKTAINADQQVFLSMITYDIIFSGFYILIVITLGQKITALLLKPYVYKTDEGTAEPHGMEHLADESAHGYKCLVQRQNLVKNLFALLAAMVVLGLSVGVSSLFPEGLSSVMTIVLLTSFGIAGSFIKPLHGLKTSFHLGMYLILVFCVTSAAMMDTNIFFDMDYGIAGYIAFLLLGSLVIHAALCRCFGIDRDTYLISSGAAIVSVPFIPVIAGALKNREILIPGFAIAIVGYAVGNYLGILVASVARMMIGS
ncbi:DUF819 family protein [Aestuariicella sp. G3-2]|uniref:DUF819 family protein n=1 Tax=Pseudomaricurvus albidus TaxID=2842452 RepID=UPI001C0C082A|nr:DUF819 family protein [Aestuariicella albida]MBU3070930.1 DUF819 family protein [Aestuariicella albida]